MWATEYRQQLRGRELIEAHFGGRLAADHETIQEVLAELLGRRISPRWLAFLPEAYLWQPNRSQALEAEVYRSRQSDASRTWLAHLRAQVDLHPPTATLLLLLRPDAAGIVLYQIGTPNYDRFVARKCGENVRAAATTAILALLAYQDEHGDLPQRLEQLVPDQLDHLPIDDFDGAPLRYSRERRELWSVGTDLRDEGGSDQGVTPDMKQPTFFIPG